MPSESERIRLEGNSLLRENNIRAAIEKYSEGIKLCGDDVLLHSNRSAARLLLNDFEGSLADAEKCISLSPNWGKSYLRKINVLRALGRFDIIPSICQQAIKNCEKKEHDSFIAIIGECEVQSIREQIEGSWKGRVSEEMGGYHQVMSFMGDNTMKVEVFGQVQTCSYSLDLSHRPIRLIIKFGADGSLATVPYIIDIRDGGEKLAMCCPFLVPDIPESFTGPGFVLMSKCDEAKTEDDRVLRRRENVARMGDFNEKLLSYFHDFIDIISKLPSNDPLNFEAPAADAEMEANKKVIEIMSAHAKVSELELVYGRELVRYSFGVIAGGDSFESCSESIQQASVRLRELLLITGFITQEGLEQARLQYSKFKTEGDHSSVRRSKLQKKLLKKGENRLVEPDNEDLVDEVDRTEKAPEAIPSDETVPNYYQSGPSNRVLSRNTLIVCSAAVVGYLLYRKIYR